MKMIFYVKKQKLWSITKMKKIIAFSTLALTSAPVLAAPGFNPVPLPGVLALMGIGALAIIVVNHFKK